MAHRRRRQKKEATTMKFQSMPVGTVFVGPDGKKMMKANNMGQYMGICNAVEIKEWAHCDFGGEYEVVED